MYSEMVAAQDPAAGRIGRVIDAIAEVESTVEPTELRSAVAYATGRGVEILSDRLKVAAARWRRMEKRWLLSIDLGRTEPRALRLLAGLPRSEIRVVNAAEVLASPILRPRTFFHPKIYTFARVAGSTPSAFGSVVGSANLTGSGLVHGVEIASARAWVEPLKKRDRAILEAHLMGFQWFEEAWRRATSFADIIEDYESRWKRMKPARDRDDQDEEQDAALAEALGIDEQEVTLLREATALWVQTYVLYKNRGPDEPGNQVDMRRGARLFFGLESATTTRNSQLGEVYLSADGHSAVGCNLRYGDNLMDKVNLPVPGRDGPGSYDNSVLLFRRTGRAMKGSQVFSLEVGDPRNLEDWKRAASHYLDWPLKGGRGFGLLFGM